MWGWLAGATLLGLLALVVDGSSHEVEEQYSRVSREVDHYNSLLTSRWRDAEDYAEYQRLTNLHWQSHLVSQEEYRILDGLRQDKRELAVALSQAKHRRSQLDVQIDSAYGKQRQDLIAEKQQLRELIQQIRQKLDEFDIAINARAERVACLRRSTRELKFMIRDTCGWRGQDWYERLEARKQSRLSGG